MSKVNLNRRIRRELFGVISVSVIILVCVSAFCLKPSAAKTGVAFGASAQESEPVLYRSKSLAAKLQSVPSMIRAEGWLKLYENTSFHVHTMLPGSICQDNAVIGQYYRQGALLALIESPELVRQTAEFLSHRAQLEMSIKRKNSAKRVAKSDLDRIQQLVNEGIAAEKDLEQAKEEVRSVNDDLEDLKEQQIRLENECQTLTTMYGIKSLDAKLESASSRLPLRAPKSG